MVTLSTAWGQQAVEKQLASERSRGPSYKRRQISILYLFNDLLHHTKFHNDSSSAYTTLVGSLQLHMVELIRTLATYDRTIHISHHKKIKTLLDEWSRNAYFSTAYTEKLRETALQVGTDGNFQGQLQTYEMPGDVLAKNDSWNKPKKDTPFLMPATHGDSSTPYYDLPAGNMMPHILPNSATPINTHLVKPIQLSPGPANNDLVVALKDFFKDVDALYGQHIDDDEGISMDIDEMGQSIVRDEVTGDAIGGDGYYGWSHAFCERMKRRHKRKSVDVRGRNDSASEEESQSRYKRRRRSSSAESSSFSRGTSRSRSRSNRRTGVGPNESYLRGRLSGTLHSRSRSPSRSRSRSHNQGFQTLRSRSRPGSSRSRSYSPPPQFSTSKKSQTPSSMHMHVSATASAPPPPYPMAFPQGIPVGPGGVPLPPPPPPNYNGPWPPPPPPPPLAQNADFTSSKSPFHNYSTFTPPSHPELSRTHNSGVSSLPVGPRNYQNQPTAGSEGWGQQPAQQYGGAAPGYSQNAPPANAQNNNPQHYGYRGRGGRGGWR